jgi:hypothetical protein
MLPSFIRILHHRAYSQGTPAALLALVPFLRRPLPDFDAIAGLPIVVIKDRPSAAPHLKVIRYSKRVYGAG